MSDCCMAVPGSNPDQDKIQLQLGTQTKAPPKLRHPRWMNSPQESLTKSG